MIWKKLPLCKLLKLSSKFNPSIPDPPQVHPAVRRSVLLDHPDLWCLHLRCQSEKWGLQKLRLIRILDDFGTFYFSWIAANSNAFNLYHQQPITHHFAGTTTTSFRPLGTRAEYQYYTTCMPTPTGKSGLLSSHQVRNQGYTGMVGNHWEGTCSS